MMSTIDAEANRKVVVVDIPNAYIQTDNEGELVHMKVRGELSTLLTSVENGKPTLYLKVLKAIYGLL